MTLPLFLVPILAGLVAQGLKVFFNKKIVHTHTKSDGWHMPHYGGMPSAHASFSFSLATLVLMTEGVFSVSFALAASLVIFVLDDALRMRIFLGRHGLAIRKLIARLPEEKRQEFPHLEASLGHKPMEVLAGAVLGTLLTIVLLIIFP